MIYLINAESTATETNTGMKTVDMAWNIFLKKHNINIKFKRFSVKAKKQNIHVTKKIHLLYEGYLNINYDDFTSEDILVFWGDFIHSRHYLQHDLKRITKKRRRDINTYIPPILKSKKQNAYSSSEYLNLVYNSYLLKDQDQKKLKGSISFGTTLIGDSDFFNNQDKEYKKSFTNFVKNLDYIWTRDVHSALQVSHLRNDYDKSHLGVDAALIIGKDEYLNVLDDPSFQISKKDYILTHFTRTKAPINSMLNISHEISKKINADLFWIPWLSRINEEKFSNKDKKFDYIKEICDTNYSDLIHAVMNSKLIVTDTYHLALIAWRLRVPVVCIGTGVQYPYLSVDDKKKETFYTMHNMIHLYLFAETLRDEEKINKYINFVIENLEKNYFDTIFDKIEQQSIIVQKQLVSYLKDKINS